MRDLNDRVQELLVTFRKEGYCTECWVNLKEESHDDLCPLAALDKGETE